jgi:hypothetical protein
MRVDAFSLHTFRYEISFWVSEMSWFFGPDEISRDFRMSVHAL